MAQTTTLSWAVFFARYKAAFEEGPVRVGIAFWFFGFINAVLYHVILSAALDIVGPSIPKGMVLLVDVIPCFLAKLLAVPLNFHRVPYRIRILGFVALSTSGMLLIAFTGSNHDRSSIAAKMAGIALASISSGGGELSFLGLTHFYGHLSLAGYASGSGAAGLIGAGAYVAATIWLGLDVKSSLLLFSLLPILLLASFFVVLPRGPLRIANSGATFRYDRILDDDLYGQEEGFEEHEGDGLNTTPYPSSSDNCPSQRFSFMERIWRPLWHNVQRCRSLFIPYMLPLLLVYLAEYTINQGITPTLLFPLASSPFKNFRDFYPTYIAFYQIGVFIARSSISFVRIHALYIPSFLQCANLVILFIHAMLNFIPSVYIIFPIIFWEGLLGGLVYVNTFAEITDNVPIEDREFSLGATSASDSGGVCIAAILSMGVETFLCNYQVRYGRDFCKKV